MNGNRRLAVAGYLLIALVMFALSPGVLARAVPPGAQARAKSTAVSSYLASATVSGTVSGSDQGFLSGATVVIEASPRRQARTDVDGRFTLTDVPSGTHRFLVSAEGYLPLDRTIDVGSASISVDIMLLKLPGVP